jgi:hypothetical protein
MDGVVTHAAVLRRVTFLVAMQRRAAAEKYLRHAIDGLRAELKAEPSNGDAARRHMKLLELLVVEFVLEQDGAAAALRLVRDDPALDDITRLVRSASVSDKKCADD